MPHMESHSEIILVRLGNTSCSDITDDIRFHDTRDLISAGLSTLHVASFVPSDVAFLDGRGASHEKS